MAFELSCTNVWMSDRTHYYNFSSEVLSDGLICMSTVQVSVSLQLLGFLDVTL